MWKFCSKVSLWNFCENCVEISVEFSYLISPQQWLSAVSLKTIAVSDMIQKLSSNIVIKNGHQKLSSKIASQIFIKKFHQKLSSKLVIKNCHQNCHQKISSKIVTKNCHQKMSSKTVTRNCNQKLLSKVVIKKFPSKIGNLVTLAISLCMYISTFTQYCQSTLRLMYILILYHYCIRIAFVLHSYCIRIALS